MFVPRSDLLLVTFVLAFPLACGNDEGDPVGASDGSSNDDAPSPELVCPEYTSNAYPEMAPFVVEKASYSSPLDGAFSVSPTGSPRYSIALEIPPGRRMAPNLELILGNAEVSIAGLSSIHRCGANLALNGELRGVQLSPEDHYCLNGSRLIQIGTGSDSIDVFADPISLTTSEQSARHQSKVWILMETRQNLLRKLDETAASAEAIGLSSKCKTICFQIMYGLPWELQIRAACHMCERYLPIFEAKWPGVAWPRLLLGDVDAWHRVNGRGTEHIPEEADSADSAYLFCFDFLLSAYHHKDDPVSLTSGCCGAMGYTAYARASNVWLADDAVAAHIEQEKDAYHRLKDAHHRNEDGSYREEEEDYPPEPEYFDDLWKPEHNSYNNVAFMAVYRREFQHIAEWLRAEEVWKYPEPDDMVVMMHGLKRWEDHEFLPMGPERKDPHIVSE